MCGLDLGQYACACPPGSHIDDLTCTGDKNDLFVFPTPASVNIIYYADTKIQRRVIESFLIH